MSSCDECDPCNPPMQFPQRIPCIEGNLKAIEWHIDEKVPAAIRDNKPNIVAMGGTIYDLWLIEAEQIIITDLLKMSTPIRIENLNNINQLTRVKALKTCELLFRTNAIDADDINDKRAAYCAGLYQAELSSLPLRMMAGAQVVPKYGVVRN